jgi:hypothetical protein
MLYRLKPDLQLCDAFCRFIQGARFAAASGE